MADFVSDMIRTLPASPDDATSAPASPFVRDMLEKFAPANDPTSELARATNVSERASVPSWDFADQTLHGLMLGGYAPARAYTAAKAKGTPYADERARIAREQASYEHTYPLRAMGGELLGSGLTTGAAMMLGQEYAAAPFAAKVAQFAPKAAQYLTTGEGVVPFLGRAVGRLAGYGTTGAATGALQSGLTDQDLPTALTKGAEIGAIAGPVGGALAAPLKSAIDPAIAKLGSAFTSLGNRLYPSQIEGGPMATKLFGSTATKGQLEDFTRGLSRTFGEDSPTITNDLLHGTRTSAGAFDRIGATLENASRNATIPGNDPALVGAMRTTLQRAANEFGPDSPEFAKVARLAQGTIDATRATGNIEGSSYLDLTQKGSAIKSAMARTSPVRQYAIEFKDALDDALQRNNPAQAKDIAQARHQWHNAIIAEGNVDPVTGLADPNTLLRSVESARHYGSAFVASKKAADATDSGDIGTLALGGKTFLTGEPSAVSTFAGKHPVALGASIPSAMLLGEHAGGPLAEYLMHSHPMATAAGLGLTGGYVGAGALMNRPGYANALLSGFDPVASAPNALIPSANYLYERRTTPEGYPYFQAQ